MSKAPRAVRMSFNLPAVAAGTGMTVTDTDQPYPCAAASLLVGLHGGDVRHALSVSYEHLRANGLQVRTVVIQLRPRADRVADRRFGDGLRGVRYFHPVYSSLSARERMAEVWRKISEALAQRHGWTIPLTIDWSDPESYMCECPYAAVEVFEMLPDLEVMVAFTKVGRSVVAVAIVPIAKLKRLAEWGEENRQVEQIKVRGTRNGKLVNILLPTKTFAVPASLRPLIGVDRYKRGEHPLRRQESPVA